ncbi:GntR family transcriptional regulator [bacterium]|nr:GntR family transcriptional regulator [bacterium]
MDFTSQNTPEKIKYQSMPEMIKDQLMDWIMDGVIEMGDQLNTNELAEQFGVSTMPVRDALKMLEKSGIAYSIPFVGTKVVELKTEDILEVYLMRKALEPMAGFYACENLNDGAVPGIENSLDQQRQLFTKKNPSAKEIFILNRDFHFRIYQMSKMTQLVSMISMLWDKLAFYKLIYGRRYLRNQSSAVEMLTEHRSYLDALKKRDGSGLKRMMEQSLQKHILELEDKKIDELRNQN